MTEPETTDESTAMQKVPQPHGGALNRGGTRGNKGGGRPPEWFKEMCRELLTTPKAKSAVKKILDDPDHPHYASMWRAVGERGFGKVEQPLGLTGPPGSSFTFTLDLGAANVTDADG